MTDTTEHRETKAEKDAKAAEVNPHTGMNEEEADKALRALQEADDLMHNGGLKDNSLVEANEEAAKAEEKAAKEREAEAKKADSPRATTAAASKA